MTDYIPVLTAILVLITGYYAWQTRIMVKEMESARKYQFLPSLKVFYQRLYNDELGVKICNIGMGPAKNIRGTLKLEPDGEEVDIVYTTLYPKESFSLFGPFKMARSQILQTFDVIAMIVCFEDIANNHYEVTDVFNLKDIYNLRDDMGRRDKKVDELRNIAHHLEQIRRSLDEKE